MTLGEIDTTISKLTGADTSSVGYPTASRLIDVNTWQHTVADIIFGSADEVDFDDERRSDYPIKYISLVADTRDYTIPVSEKVVAIKTVSISYDGVSFVQAYPIDSKEIGVVTIPAETTAETTIDGNFTRNEPRYDSKYNSIFIYPRPTASEVAAGAMMVVEWEREMQEYTLAEWTTGTEVPGFDTAFQKILAFGPSYEWCLSNQEFSKADRIMEKMLNPMVERLKKTFGRKQKDREWALMANLPNYK